MLCHIYCHVEGQCKSTINRYRDDSVAKKDGKAALAAEVEHVGEQPLIGKDNQHQHDREADYRDRESRKSPRVPFGH